MEKTNLPSQENIENPFYLLFKCVKPGQNIYYDNEKQNQYQ